ncbi:MAG: hypothetical protein OEZ41_08120, partial [Nitrospirota bacterium]|nr:hypothetical protein [Nitrospirota bacterium]
NTGGDDGEKSYARSVVSGLHLFPSLPAFVIWSLSCPVGVLDAVCMVIPDMCYRESILKRLKASGGLSEKFSLTNG